MTELKTKKTQASVAAFLKGIADDGRRRDCRELAAMMKEATGRSPKMWGDSIVGFGDFQYVGSGGRECDWFIAGFAPRKDALTLYLMGGVERHRVLLKQLGKHKTGRACLYIKKLDDVDRDVLRTLIEKSVQEMPKVR